MRGSQSSGSDVDIDIVRLFVAVWERRIAIVSLLLIVSVAAFVLSGMSSPRYRAEARILIESRQSPLSGANQTTNGRPQFLDEQGIVSQVEIINSTNLIKSVADQLDLVDNREFSSAAKPSLIESLLIQFGFEEDPYDASPEERLIERFREHMTVYQVDNSRVIVVTFWSVDRQLAAQAANAIAQTYLTLQSGAKVSTNVDATAWLEPEIADLRDKVRAAEAKVAQFRAESGLLLVDSTETLATRQLSEISSELSRVRGEKAEAQARATAVRNAIESGRPSEDFANLVQSDVIQRLRERQAALQAQIADLSVTLLEQHPRIKGLRSQLNDIEKQIQAETRGLLRTFENDAEIAQLREDELNQQLGELKADSARAGGDEVELRALEREATAQRELLEVYLSRYREAASLSDRGDLPADARVISEALVPTKPYYPKPVPVAIIAGLVTFLLSSLAIMLFELFSGRALRPVDYGVAPTNSDAMEPEAAVDPGPPIGTGLTPKPFDDVPVAGVSDKAEPGAEAFETAREDDAVETFAAEQSDVVVSAHTPDLNADPVGADAPVAANDDSSAENDETLDEDVVVEAGPAVEEPPHDSLDAKVPVAADIDDGIIEDHEPEYSVSAVTDHLIAAGTRLAIVVSPEGDKGSMTSVMLARMLANEGSQALLLDMTGSACPSRMMVPHSDLPGITDVLVDDCTVPEALHADRLSNAHILPQGITDPAMAMQNADKLPDVVGALTKVYDIVIVECGPANSAGVKRLLDGQDVEMIFSVVQPDDDLMVEYLNDFYSEGFQNLLMMSPGAGAPGSPDRTAA
ncbi:Wzz/FepE/Etk N-terminal domain-containing protein [Hoeflea prorocentri]|uniref:Wzz/FepE/Etk N-terminal domain-containing protein n=1 Tax=Hoeflea prorocentri TaxID=1922333 RepID=A0A9X3UKA7_9HYPH|nr:Wzz/FepE/Etk N-terminal domain-containing protein [Hoeflea prorocentri]MCY6380421.1 Wzz/FepE/Etk N-terminal domain-containing protein [Hoeflea prorocentri]MDA5398221.1 Wzz/FepE/Etk N-terminal domain-containing protein [Hoeflea prorocentri]